MTAARARLEALLASQGDSALLRFSLGLSCRTDAPEEAIAHFRRAVELDPGYSAAWKELGRALAQHGHHGDAVDVFNRGIAVAEQRGDMQAVKEMRVFLKRLRCADASAAGARESFDET